VKVGDITAIVTAAASGIGRRFALEFIVRCDYFNGRVIDVGGGAAF
jgi:NAD(P)-dependent dehydrogenase (short-subunit alcohol dehydrogenase family)